MTGCGSSCGACKFLRRKCTVDCVFAPYFSYDQAATHFAAVHKVFGASNVSRLLSHLPIQNRSDAAITISYEALARVHDPIYGCVAHIFALQQQIASLQEEIDILSVMANSSVGAAGCGSFLAPTNSNNGIELPNLQNDDTRIQNYHDQAFGLENQLFGESNLNTLEKLLYGIDQEVSFLNHPWFNQA
ncbi:LOB domain-containing protein 33 [Senna tora]|uniref:LOB domain-containing protein 33 n=1 Tax=Senna tora TaxID=362788 RepID=A0A834WCV2_9FABA|nr:LOB domain-containing protein 33 [Senna tora]